VNQPGQVPRLARGAYTSWVRRLVATILDVIPCFVIVGIGFAVELGTKQTLCAPVSTPYDIAPFCATGNSVLGVTVFLSSFGVVFLYLLWNYGYRQGTTGSSLGKSRMKFKVVGERTGQPIGFGKSVLRQIAHVIDSLICNIGYLFPLWDARRQTIADKIVNTVCLPVSGTR
jgi:uncharacterized RDD family membrane protein YckC